jgi:hypothetical protein
MQRVRRWEPVAVLLRHMAAIAVGIGGTSLVFTCLGLLALRLLAKQDDPGEFVQSQLNESLPRLGPARSSENLYRFAIRWPRTCICGGVFGMATAVILFLASDGFAT